MSDMLRITGLATGLDVDEMVKSLMKAENMRLDKIKQDRQIVQWKQDLYRDILGNFNVFKSTYFDILKSDTYMLSGNNYANFDVASVDSASSAVTPTATATAGTGAVEGTYSVMVDQIAKPAAINGTSISNNQANVTIESGFIKDNDWAGKVISFSVDGKIAANIALPAYSGNNTTIDTLISDINSAISANESLKGKLSVSKVNADTMQFNTLMGNTVKVVSGTSTAPLAGITVDKAINPAGYTKLSDLGMTSPVTFSITYNGTTKSVTANSTDTISSFINTISSATSNNVVAKYSQLTGKFILETSNTGGATSISIDTSIPELGLTAGSGTLGQDALVQITPPGGTSTTVIKSANNFTIDGVTYTLNSQDSSKTTKITIASNVQKTFDKIKAFIDKYNEVIDKVQTKISEKRQYSFKPLTDEQKKDMKEDEIKKWEEKTKEGILKNESSLQNMLYSMRRAFYDKVEDAGISLGEIGISTDSDYTMGGKIIIDEAKLKSAIKDHGTQVANLFMKDSDIDYDPDHKTDENRYKDIGIFQRINDIFKDYTRTTRDSNGNKGILIQKAGIKGDLSEFDNMLSKDLKDNYDKKIYELVKKLVDKENRYYEQFSRLESAIQRMNQQSSWLAQQFGSGK